MTYRDIIQRILSLYSKGVQSQSIRLADRHVANKMTTVRSKLVSQEAKKKQKINQWSYQTLNCVELIKAQPNECPCIAPPGCEILRSKYPIPKPLTDLNKHLIQSVTTLDGDIIFSEITWTEKKYKKYSKYTANKPDYFIRNNYLYITSRIGLKVITVTGLFDDPLAAYNFPSMCKDCVDCHDCTSPLDMEFPIDNDMVDTLIDMCKDELIAQFSQMPEDLRNNAIDSLPENSK